MGYWEDREKAVHERTIAAYNERRLPRWFVFAPYVRWIQEPRRTPHISEVREMRAVAHSLLNEYDRKHPSAFGGMEFREDTDYFYLFNGYGEDKEKVGILSNINEELTSFLIVRME